MDKPYAPACAPTSEPSTGPFNYAEALQKALYFYEAQRSGALPKSHRVNWRGESAMRDGQDFGIDLTGGWFDAGDTLKFNITMAYAAGFLAWSGVDHFEAYENTCQLFYLLENLRFVNDYFLKTFFGATTGEYVLYSQVGSNEKGAADNDHRQWIAPELIEYFGKRPAFKIDTKLPGSDVAGSEAAAMAASAIVFHKAGDEEYAQQLLSTAQALYDFANEYRGNTAEHKDHEGNVRSAKTYRHPGIFYGHLMYAAVWLSLAEKELSPSSSRDYLAAAKALFDSSAFQNEQHHNWRIVGHSAGVLLARQTHDPKHVAFVTRWLDSWIEGKNGITRQPDGLVYSFGWGTIRQATAVAWLAAAHSRSLPDGGARSRYVQFAERQFNYALGQNALKRSFVVGFGNAPNEAHHRGQHGPWASWQHFIAPEARMALRHTLYGGLIGGPIDGEFPGPAPEGPWPPKYYEVALDYNAGLTAGMAWMAERQGGVPSSEFPPAEVPDDEYFVQARVTTELPRATRVEAELNNRSAWPARRSESLSFRYFVKLEPGVLPKDVSIRSIESDCGPQAVSSTLQSTDTGFHYVAVDCTGTPIMPGGLVGNDAAGERYWARRVVFELSTHSDWNPANDPSYAQAASQSELHKVAAIPVYERGALIFGTEP